MNAMPVFFWVGCYFLIGVLIHLYVPKTPRAQEAFAMGEKAHPAGALIALVLVATFWPFVIIGWGRRLLRRK